MDAFWCIVLSTIVLRWWWKHNKPDFWDEEKKPAPTLSMKEAEKMQKEAKDKQALEEVQRQRDRDINDLRKQGYTDELIAVILPTINNG